MNYIDGQVFLSLIKMKDITQQKIAQKTGFSLGTVNQSLKRLIGHGLLNSGYEFTMLGKRIMEENSVKRAVILAAGFGMRMVPINTETPKGLLEVHGETLIERLIRQLKAVGIEDITIVVGFMKEAYEYLIDEYHVKLICNRHYQDKNNLYSAYLAKDQFDQCYILPCDIWSRENPFSSFEFHTWYMVKQEKVHHSKIYLNRKLELSHVKKGDGNKQVGIAYIKNGTQLRNMLVECNQKESFDGAFWEDAFFACKEMIYGKLVSKDEIIEINTYEELRELDSQSNQLNSSAIEMIANALKVHPFEIINIQVLKKGMTNRSFLFQVKNQRYIMRIPGTGTDELIHRNEEYDVYQVVNPYRICDEIICMNPDNGYKITKFIEDAHNCDASDFDDIQKCMKALRQFHALKLTVNHRFDIFEKIDFYESLWNGKCSIYKDYETVKKQIQSLQGFIQSHVEEEVLTHIDAVCDNFLIKDNHVFLIDWEYAAMQDPHVDIAMFCIYALYQQKQVDQLIDIYFEYRCPQEIRIKIYCYIAACGLLWSNWCEYKRHLGVEFGEYSILQYRYAKDYFKLVQESGLLTL